MIVLDLPPQVEMQIVEIAKAQNMSANDYLVSMAKEIVAQQQQDIDDEEFYRIAGFRPLTTGKHIITNEMVNALREEHGI